MKLREIFEKDITRDIKGVIKASQDNEYVTKQELEEYIVTKELQKHFSYFFENYKKSIGNYTDKMGVWISGFFGSGKSHFLKILAYLLGNEPVDNKTPLQYFIDDNKIIDNITLADMKLATQVPTDVILFNIDSKNSSNNEKEKIISAFLKVFNQHLGYYGQNPFLADLERQLDKDGKFEEFKEMFFNITNENWVDVRKNMLFIQDDLCKSLVDINYMTEEASKNFCQKATSGSYEIDFTDFAHRVKEYIDEKGNDHHLIFLVDEIGQYIGEDSKLMLNLQTLVEELGTVCKGKAWVIVTSQQDMESIADGAGNTKNDFSKIQGRFDTRIALSSADVDEVIKKRILEKTETAKQMLSLIYDEKHITIKNLISFNDGVEKKIYLDEKDFIETYPFVSYQFDILGNVLNEIRKNGASGKHLSEGERSMIALFKESAMKLGNKEEGVVVPFYLFYDAIENFLDHNHRNVITHSLRNTHLNLDNDEFDTNVLKVLFMIKYVDKIKSNVENITSLMVSNINDDRLELKQKVEESLKRLRKQNLIEKNLDIYIFLTDEEQDINNQINDQHIEINEVLAKVSETIFEEIYSENKYNYPLLKNKYSFSFNQKLDDKPYKTNQNFEISLEILTSEYDTIEVTDTNLILKASQNNSVIVSIAEENSYLDEVTRYLKIEKFLRTPFKNTILKGEQIELAKREELKTRKENAKMFLEEVLRKGKIYVNNGRFEGKSNNISNLINDAMGKLVDRVYYKLNYITNPMEEASIKNILSSYNSNVTKLTDNVGDANEKAIKEVLHYISSKATLTKLSLKTIVERFKKQPYGFNEVDIQWIIANLLKNGEINFSLNSEVITLSNTDVEEIFRYLTRKEYLEKLLIEIKQKATERQKRNVKDIEDILFGNISTNTDDEMILKNFKSSLNSFIYKLENIKNKYKNDLLYKYPDEKIVDEGIKITNILSGIISSKEFFEEIDEKFDRILNFGEDFENIKKFFAGTQVNIWNEINKDMKIYEKSKELINDEKLENIVEEIKAIMRSASPYKDIKRLPELKENYSNLYLEYLEEKSKPVLESIEETKKYLFEETENEVFNEDFRKNIGLQINNTLNKLVDDTNNCDNIAEFSSIIARLDSSKIRFIEQIRREEQAINERIAREKRMQEIENNEIEDEEDVEEIVVTRKEEKFVSIKSVSVSRSWRIETEEDIEKYVNQLKQALKSNLKDDIILNIEL